MIQPIYEVDPEAPVVLVEIGNTKVKLATWFQSEVKTPLSVPVADADAFDQAFTAHVDGISATVPPPTIVGSVVPDALKRVREYVRQRYDRDVLVVGEKVALPLDVGVDDVKSIGVDRVCAAAAAYDKIENACVVVDIGTAITVDLVDDDGTLIGGAILPGLHLQLRALHEFTAQLPEVEPALPELPYGRNTVEAMQNGVCRGVAGAIRELVEGYASSINRWPQVVATGGGLELMSPVLTFVDTMVTDLSLRGLGLAYRKHLEALGA